MNVYRILKAPYDKDPLSVVGSMLMPGRWNMPDQGLLYTASHPALALLETMVHFQTKPYAQLPALTLYELEVPGKLTWVLPQKRLPPGWNTPAGVELTQPLLAAWIDQPIQESRDFLGVKVPSAILPMSDNYLFAPNHPRFGEIRVLHTYPLPLDLRLWRV